MSKQLTEADKFLSYHSNPIQVGKNQLSELNSLINEYPYCQSLHFLAAKAAAEDHEKASYLANAATFASSRETLFDFLENPLNFHTPISKQEEITELVEEQNSNPDFGQAFGIDLNQTIVKEKVEDEEDKVEDKEVEVEKVEVEEEKTDEIVNEVEEDEVEEEKTDEIVNEVEGKEVEEDKVEEEKTDEIVNEVEEDEVEEDKVEEQTQEGTSAVAENKAEIVAENENLEKPEKEHDQAFADVETERNLEGQTIEVEKVEVEAKEVEEVEEDKTDEIVNEVEEGKVEVEEEKTNEIVSEVEVEEDKVEEEKVVDKVENDQPERKKKSLEEILFDSPAQSDFFAFSIDKTSNKEKPSENAEEKIVQYHDDTLPYTFLWWLNKTRKEHASNNQPYTKRKTAQQQTAIIESTLNHQIAENIFHLRSVDEVVENKKETNFTVPYDFRQKEHKIIEKFIAEEPQIKPPAANKIDTENKAKKSSEDSNEVVSETLAKIYVEQMLYHKALDVYKKLSLKYPEKSTYFASQIKYLELKVN
ncbi:hypothetical protein I5M32_12460 [Pedobacter sp. SD-b]|uniref:Uncharacterized protein n=1 Tax=Pedobacter segetis TaxID=2793069 RepID=A0ABS1BLK7_9SPHI|nr:hypothetical protein [Pedobacter segetis]MBK0383773.1 hypothetical protein [Pedobacter segetis]